jgi:vacuolar protein sorting-associated protein 13B
MFKPDTMVCGSAAEVNCLTDLELMVNLNQIKLFLTLYSQFKSLALSDEREEVIVTDFMTRPKKPVVTFNSKIVTSNKYTLLEPETDFTKDSGIDFETSSVNSMNNVRFY